MNGVLQCTLLTTLLCFALTGCTSFHRQWNRAAKQSFPADSIEGRWDGTWRSEESSHRGRLCCILTKAGDTEYRARFQSTFALIFGFGYTATLTGHETNGVVYFQGRAELAKWAGGSYHYEGHATPTNFVSTYRCGHDHGVFEMKRP